MHAGAKLAIIINDSNENILEASMPDDGTSGGIRIPAVMVSKKDGEILKKAAMDMTEGESIEMTM